MTTFCRTARKRSNPLRLRAGRCIQAGLAAASLTLALPGGVGAQTTRQPEPPSPPDPRFGAVETYHTPELADEAGVGWTRIIFYWSELKKDGPGTWNVFHAPLARIDRELAGGREVVGLLKHTPAFATEGIAGAGVPRGLYLSVDDPDNLWAGFVREVVGAYAGRVDRWIIWNEPDIPLDTYGAQWAGSVEDYYRLVKVASLAAREANPAATIHLGGLTYWHNPAYLREFLTAASADPEAAANHYFFDVVSVHVYFKPETIPLILRDLRTTLGEFGLADTPIWLNETNAPPYDDPAQPWAGPVFNVSQEMQAAYLIQATALALASGAERVAVYKWIDEPPLAPGFEPYGLLRGDRSPRPAYDAFRVVTAHFAGVTGAEQHEQPAFQQVTLRRGEQTTRVLWARGARGVVVRVPALAAQAALVSPHGETTLLSAQRGAYVLALPGAPCAPEAECFIGGEPLVLVEDAPAPADVAEAAAALQGRALPGASLDAGAVRPAGRMPTYPPRTWLSAGLTLAAAGLLLVALNRQHPAR